MKNTPGFPHLLANVLAHSGALYPKQVAPMTPKMAPSLHDGVPPPPPLPPSSVVAHRAQSFPPNGDWRHPFPHLSMCERLLWFHAPRLHSTPNLLALFSCTTSACCAPFEKTP